MVLTRHRYRLVLGFTIVFAIAACGTGCSRGVQEGTAPGNMAPQFSLPLLGRANQKGALSDYIGQVVLINFWASWCAPCVAELPSLERLASRLRGHGFTVLGIAVDDQESELQQFQSRYGLSFPILLDTTSTVKNRYRLTGVPESYVIDRQGRILLIADPADGAMVTRIVGPREWDAPGVIAQFEGLLRNP